MKHIGPTPVLLAILVLAAIAGTSCGHEFWASPITSLTISPPAPSLLVGNQQQFTATATYQNGTTKVLPSTAWTTSNAAIVPITSSGLATAIATGSATISASVDGISASTTVSVITSALASIQISPTNASVSVTKTTQQFTATGTFDDGTLKDISSSVSWSSSNTSVAAMSQTGVATLLTTGTTTISATSGTISGSTTLTVTQ